MLSKPCILVEHFMPVGDAEDGANLTLRVTNVPTRWYGVALGELRSADFWYLLEDVHPTAEEQATLAEVLDQVIDPDQLQLTDILDIATDGADDT